MLTFWGHTDSEPKWVLKRLMWALEQELKSRAERHIERDIGAERLPPSSSSSKSQEKKGTEGGTIAGAQLQAQHDATDFAERYM